MVPSESGAHQIAKLLFGAFLRNRDDSKGREEKMSSEIIPSVRKMIEDVKENIESLENKVELQTSKRDAREKSLINEFERQLGHLETRIEMKNVLHHLPVSTKL